ncbi:uncharacterized protein LOC117653647 [Thrips palmi]|uniref:Uncharacterized protein LOC117653647 n=1 Tax=Thrips palmi TaxID=161013 RepID=A0A6P9AB64_THRPL|nr:uncharacterized protein LOC117653647 [Thrips palmi]
MVAVAITTMDNYDLTQLKNDATVPRPRGVPVNVCTSGSNSTVSAEVEVAAAVTGDPRLRMIPCVELVDILEEDWDYIMAPAKKYRTFDPDSLERALNAVKNCGISIRAASKTYKVPYITLNRHVNGLSQSLKPGRPPKLVQYEAELHDAVVTMVDMGHGATVSDIMELAVETVDKAGRSPFKSKDDRPSRRWYRGFKKRNNLSLRQPENMSANRFRMATPEVKKDFFDKLEAMYKKLIPLGLQPSQIYNTDETGVCVVTKPGKVLAVKGSKNVRERTGGERGENVTAVVTVNATGSHILPPTLIFRGQSLNMDLTEGAPEGTVFAYSKRSFIDSELFVEWFKRFIAAIPPARPVLLLMDGHGSHIQLEIIEMARSNDINILLFPPHTTNFYQPLDVGVFKSFKSAFSSESSKLMRKNKIKNINRYHIAQVLNSAWVKGITPANIQGGFRGSGVWPLNADAVTLPGTEINPEPESIQSPNADTVPAQAQTPGSQDQGLRPRVRNLLSKFSKDVMAVMDEAETQHNRPGAGGTVARGDATAQRAAVDAGNATVSSDSLVDGAHTGTSSNLQSVGGSTPSPVVSAVRSLLMPANDACDRPRSRCITQTRVITSDEFFKEMQEKEAAKKKKEDEKKAKAAAREEARKRKAAAKKKVDRNKKSKKQKHVAESEDEAEAIDDPSEEEKNKSDSDEDEDNEKCGVCEKSFQQDFNGEQWIQCSGKDCNTWFHMKCVKVAKYIATFRCEWCTPVGHLKKK